MESFRLWEQRKWLRVFIKLEGEYRDEEVTITRELLADAYGLGHFTSLAAYHKNTN